MELFDSAVYLSYSILGKEIQLTRLKTLSLKGMGFAHTLSYILVQGAHGKDGNCASAGRWMKYTDKGKAFPSPKF